METKLSLIHFKCKMFHGYNINYIGSDNNAPAPEVDSFGNNLLYRQVDNIHEPFILNKVFDCLFIYRDDFYIKLHRNKYLLCYKGQIHEYTLKSFKNNVKKQRVYLKSCAELGITQIPLTKISEIKHLIINDNKLIRFNKNQHIKLLINGQLCDYDITKIFLSFSDDAWYYLPDGSTFALVDNDNTQYYRVNNNQIFESNNIEEKNFDYLNFDNNYLAECIL